MADVINGKRMRLSLSSAFLMHSLCLSICITTYLTTHPPTSYSSDSSLRVSVSSPLCPCACPPPPARCLSFASAKAKARLLLQMRYRNISGSQFTHMRCIGPFIAISLCLDCDLGRNISRNYKIGLPARVIIYATYHE